MNEKDQIKLNLVRPTTNLVYQENLYIWRLKLCLNDTIKIQNGDFRNIDENKAFQCMIGSSSKNKK